MGINSLPLLHSLDLKGIILQGNENDSNKSSSLWNKFVEAQAKRRRQAVRKQKAVLRKNREQIRCRRPRRILMKRRSSAGVLEGSRRPSNIIDRKVRTLKKLVPNSESSTGLDGLFRETADYILALQMKVNVMQVMVKVLTGSDDK
ncbi:hypothetical protein Dsin_025622 [Dipteronia sinensis]|uniref:Transcription factor UPBEAT1 n=1 Tax=Dipteronia sinensis TaxID=43782 RepID=A0AAE0DX50_9ROSI|nr:hypothetical protein Dsin_025622 [Dipteronia sinensis]